MNTLIEHLAEACRTHRVLEKWLVAPSLRVGHQWLDQVALAGTPVVNARVLTVRSLALQVIGARLAKEGVAVASPAARRLAVAAAWQDVMRDDGYLGKARRTPGLLALAEATILDLKLAGVGPTGIKTGDFEQRLKAHELTALLGAYQAELDRRGLIDNADAARLATAELAGNGAAGREIVLLRPGDIRLTAVEQALLDAVAGENVVTLAVDEPGGDDSGTDLPVRFVHAAGEANEVRGVLRSCLGEESSLDTVEVLYTASKPYVSLIYETAQRVFEPDASLDLGIPVTFADGVPARLSRPGRLLAAWHEWIHDGFPQSGLLRMLQAGLLRSPTDDEGHAVATAGLVRTLRRTGIGFGRDRYRQCLQEHIDSIERPGSHLQSARALAGFVKTLISVSPEPSAFAAVAVTAAKALLGDHARVADKLDGLAVQRLGQELDAMTEALDGGTADPPGFDVWQWLEELPERITIGGSGPRPGHLHAVPLRGGGHSGRTNTFVLGLDDGRFPSAGRQDPLLLDVERRQVATSLRTSDVELHEQLEQFDRLLAGLRGRLTLSFSSRNIDDDRETFAGPVLLAAWRRVSGERDGDHAALMKRLGPAISFAPRDADRCLDSGEWWLYQAAREPRVENLPELAETAFDHLARGSAAGAARASDAFTVYDGLVDEPGPELDPCTPRGPVMSATSGLQAIGKCPLAYFYARVLKIELPRDVEVDPDEWLDAMQFGTLLHEVLFRFVERLITDDTWPPEPERDLPVMAAIVESLADDARRRNPPPNEDAYRRRRRRLDRSAEIFVNEQARRAGPGRPVYLEASIGLPTEQRGTDIDAPDPVEVALPGGGTIRARARIDRIDRVDDGGTHKPPTFVIYDYKSSSKTEPYDPPDLFDKGRLVQHVLYMAVAGAVLGDRFGPDTVVDGFRFMFPGVRTHGREVAFGRDVIEPGLEVIRTLCTLPATGVFLATDDPDDCRYCSYRTACQAVQRDLRELCEASKRKLDNPANTALKPFVELRRDG